MEAPTNRTLVALGVLFAAIATFFAIDLALQQFSSVPHIREVVDGMRDLESTNPETIVVGSSHARTFHQLGIALRERAPGRPPLVAIPLEGGKLTGYQWLMAHRILPLVDESDSTGRRVRSSVRRVIILTEWWDSCSIGAGQSAWNLPARAWTVGDYVADVRLNGFTELNRNFLRERVRHLLPWSVVVQRRGTGRILLDAAKAAGGRTSIHTPAQYQDFVDQWRTSIEGGASCIGDSVQMNALRWMVGEIRQRGLDADIVLFPRKPDTLTERAKAVTLAPFAGQVRALAAEEGATVFDMTTASPLRSEDFMDDFDHVSANGNQIFAHWALDHDLSFLAAPPAGSHHRSATLR